MADAGPPCVRAKATDGTNAKSPSPEPERGFLFRRPLVGVLQPDGPAARPTGSRPTEGAAGQEASLSSSRRIESPMTVVEQRAMPGAMMSAVRMPPDSTFCTAFSSIFASSSMLNE